MQLTTENIQWLAENLTNEQVASLLSEGTPAPQQPSQNPPQQPSNNPQPDPQATNNPKAQKQGNQPSSSQENINMLAQAIKNPKSKLNTSMKADEVTSLVQAKNISDDDVLKTISFALSNKNAVQQGRRGIQMLVLYLRSKQYAFAQDILTKLKENGIDINNISESVRNRYETTIFNNGRNALYESVTVKGKKTYRPTDINESISKYYSLNSKLNEVQKRIALLESKGYSFGILKSFMTVTESRRKELNESLSAVKYSIAFYRKNK